MSKPEIIRSEQNTGALDLVDKHYPQDSELRSILLVHSRSVADKALWIADKHPELNLDITFLNEAAMLHDLGIFLTHAPGVKCLGKEPYICHGYLGTELVRKESFPRHALVCGRHTSAGLSLEEIIKQRLPIPHREMLPVSMEEQAIHFADKFFSKAYPDRRKSVQNACKSIARCGGGGLRHFNNWCELLLQCLRRS